MAVQYEVETRGTFLNASRQDRKDPRWVKPTRLSLSELKVTEGDWVGLQAFGSFRYRPDDPLTSTNLAAAFVDGLNRPVRPGPGSEVLPSNLPGVNQPDRQPLGGELYFGVSQGRYTLVRVPKGAKAVAPVAPCGYWCDNSAVSYGIKISRPNLPAIPKLDAKQEELAKDCDDSDFNEWLARFAAQVDPAIMHAEAAAVAFSQSPIDGEGKAPYLPQWRGWYNDWAPAASKYGGHPQRAENHLGWDVFCPAGSKLVVPAVPCSLRRQTHDAKWGLAVAADVVTKKGRVLTIIYAHLEAVSASGSITSLGTEIARSGCSGNAGGSHCGKDGPTDARSDHVHVQVYVTENGARALVDPHQELGKYWKLRTPS